MTTATQNRIPADAVRLARTWEKAQQIAVEMKKGGEYTAYGQEEGVFGIYKKSYSDKADTSYLVNLNGKPTCTCPDFENNRDYCKHILALQHNIEEEQREAAQVAEYEDYQARLEPYGYC
jgi:predicted nucleic acid-binding Zn finger protein